MKNIFKGFGLIEILIATCIIGLALAGLATLGSYALRLQSYLQNNLIATNLAIEAIEATKAVKAESWSAFSSLTFGAPYHPAKTGSPAKWTLAAGSETINGFVRQIIISQVSRDANDDITTSGGTPDPGTRKITATVSWSDHGQNYHTDIELYLTNWKP